MTTTLTLLIATSSSNENRIPLSSLYHLGRDLCAQGQTMAKFWRGSLPPARNNYESKEERHNFTKGQNLQEKS